MSKFAVFDIDGTLIRWQLYHAIVDELAKQNHLTSEAYQQIRGQRMRWKQREHGESFKNYERTVIDAYHDAISNLDIDSYHQAIDKVFDNYKDQVYTYTRGLVAQLKSEGYTLLTVSGSQQEVISKLAQHYGFDDAVGNTYEIQDGKFTGKHQDIVKQKGRILNELVQKHGLTFDGSIAIGDSESDVQMMELVDRPIAFNPSLGLYETARSNQWKIVIERKNVVYELEPANGDYILRQAKQQ